MQISSQQIADLKTLADWSVVETVKRSENYVYKGGLEYSQTVLRAALSRTWRNSEIVAVFLGHVGAMSYAEYHLHSLDGGSRRRFRRVNVAALFDGFGSFGGHGNLGHFFDWIELLECWMSRRNKEVGSPRLKQWLNPHQLRSHYALFNVLRGTV